MKPLAICAVFKNEAPFLLEWIAHHHAIGFDRIFLYDNGSSDGGAQRVLSSAFAAFTRVIDWPDRPAQLPAYRHFIYNFALDLEWAAFIDLDEFLVPLAADGIRALLPLWDGFSAVLVHWRVFGSSGWEVPPQGLVMENYVFRTEDGFPVNRHVKSIVRCDDLLDVTANPHEFQIKGPACNAPGRAVPLTALQPGACHEGLVLNHYITRSRQDWMRKLTRGRAMFRAQEAAYRMEMFDHFAEVSTIRDEAIERFIPAVEARLKGAGARAAASLAGALERRDRRLLVTAHVQHAGDVEAGNGEWVGKRGGGRWIEGISLSSGADLPPVEYRTLLADGRWTPWVAEGLCGTRGQGIPLRGFAARSPAGCICDARFTDGSVASDSAGGMLQAPGLAPLEALRITLRLP